MLISASSFRQHHFIFSLDKQIFVNFSTIAYRKPLA